MQCRKDACRGSFGQPSPVGMAGKKKKEKKKEKKSHGELLAKSDNDDVFSTTGSSLYESSSTRHPSLALSFGSQFNAVVIHMLYRSHTHTVFK